jgi:hypothetical protein
MVSVMNAQLKIFTSGNTSIGSGTENSNVRLYVKNTSDGTYTYGLQGVGESTNKADWAIGVLGSTVYGTNGANKSVGTYGSTYLSSPQSKGRAFGVVGYAGNMTSGYNYGVIGFLLGSNNGSAIVGTSKGYEPEIDGKYAGYFDGNVDIWGVGRINGALILTSDERIKENISNVTGALTLIKQLQGIKYKLKPVTNELRPNAITGKDTGEINELFIDTVIYNRFHLGLSAQNTQKVFPELVYKDNSGMLSIDYISLIPVLIEALKDQQLQIDSMKQISNVSKNSLKSTNNLTDIENLDPMNSAWLSQNSPNPFNQNTTISYFLPETTKNAAIYIYNMQGGQIKVIQVNAFGNGNIVIYGSELNPGMYLYSLIADGKEIDTKRMILTE